MTLDPEIDELTQSVRELTRRASSLSGAINDAVEELSHFSDELVAFRDEMGRDRRQGADPGYTGVERRRDTRS